jgi:membrane-associated phospholipid phosphatase
MVGTGVSQLLLNYYISINNIFMFLLYMKPSYIDLIGYYGPIILTVSSLFLLYSKKTYLVIYIIGFVLNIVVNNILKQIIKQPRPKGDFDIFDPSKKHNYGHNPIQVYGMPSGHSQMVLYSTTFIYLVLKNIPLTLLYLLISLNTIFQRVRYKNHTVMQVIVGSLVGALVAYFVYKYATSSLVGKLKTKPDDNAREITDGYFY